MHRRKLYACAGVSRSTKVTRQHFCWYRVVISISFGTPGGFCTDYPIIQIPLSRERDLIKPSYFRGDG